MSRAVAVVTGGAQGIGKVVVQRLLQEGYQVYTIDMCEAALMVLSEVCPEVDTYCGDIAHEEVLRAFAHHLLEREEGIDLLVNNACLTRSGIDSGCSYDDFLYVQRVGVAAPYLLCKLFQAHFRPIASVINISSSRAFQSQADTESYSAAKGGITALTHALAVTLAGKARVNAIAPGWIETGDESLHTPADRLQHPAQRVGNPDDIARAILFLSHKDNSFINGETLVIDGGMSKLMVYHNDCGWSYNPKQ